MHFPLLVFQEVPWQRLYGQTTSTTTEVRAMRTSIRLWNLIILLSASLALMPAVQAEELSRAAILSASCEGCHGTGGRSPGAIPESFRSGEREATVMGRHATGYSDEEIRQIAEYFSKQ
jgi:sulfide dehydrogenase cytochrome subunit